MESTVKEILASYNATAALPDAYTIPAPWYTDARIAQLELQNVFSRTWQAVGRTAQAEHMRCPYHGWTYNLEGELRGMTEFEGVCNFDRAQNGLVPVRVETWENFIFVNLDPQATPLRDFLGALVGRVTPLNFRDLKFVERRSYIQQCNWKVYVDNFLDGGYHVPHMHKGLNSVLDYTNYTIENVDRCCVQSSPVAVDKSSEASAAATRKGDRAYYF